MVKEMNNLALAALAFLLVAIVLSVGADVLQNTSDKFDYSVKNTVAVYDGTSYNLNSSSALQLDNSNLTTDSVVVTNVTGNVVLTSGNYTVNYPSGTVVATLNNESAVNVSYSYDVYNTANVDSVDNGNMAVGELASWLPTLGLVIAAGFLLSMVFLYFRRP